MTSPRRTGRARRSTFWTRRSVMPWMSFPDRSMPSVIRPRRLRSGPAGRRRQLKGVVFDLLADLDFSAGSLLSTNILDISRIQQAVAAVNGYTLYAINHLDAEGKPGEEATIAIAGRGGISVGMRSRAETSGRLMGTKKGIVASGRLYVGRGKSDGAPLMIMPLLGGDDLVRHLLLIHVSFNEALSVGERQGDPGRARERYPRSHPGIQSHLGRAGAREDPARDPPRRTGGGDCRTDQGESWK